MKKIIFRFLFLLLTLHSQSLLAFDKRDLKDVDVDPQYFSFFSSVPLNYIVESKSNAAMVLLCEKGEDCYKTVNATGCLVNFYIDIGVANAVKENFQKRDGKVYEVRTTNMEVVLHQMYKTRNEPPSQDHMNPDYVIIKHFAERGWEIKPVYLADAKTKAYFKATTQGQTFIPAFILDEMAAVYEKQMEEKSGRALTRVANDFGEFFKLVTAEAHSKTQIIVLGAVKADLEPAPV